MRRIDCGISGNSERQAEITWDDLRLGDSWDRVLEVLRPGPTPRPAQVKALAEHRVLETRRNLILSAPTNGGKSLVGLLILLEAIRRGGRAILLEPLRAIAQEKAQELRTVAPRLEKYLGVAVRVRISTGDYRSDGETLFATPPGEGELVVATPERLEALLRNASHDEWLASVEAVCVDEAHLISSPNRGPTLEYLVTRLLCLPAPPRLVLLSATLGDLEQACSWLSPCDALVVKERRPALHKEIVQLESHENVDEVVARLTQDALTHEGTSILIFVYQTRSTERLAGLLGRALGKQAGDFGPLAYHARMNVTQREAVRSAFQSGRCRCVVSTTALGLGVNLPATHVIVRDITFRGVDSVPTEDLLQMMGRAGRGDRAGHATVIARPTDARGAEELTYALREERLPALVSHFERSAGWRQTRITASNVELNSVTTYVAAHLSRQPETGATSAELREFFGRSLGGENLAMLVPAALAWLADPMRHLAFQDEHDRYQLTTLGLTATRAVLPLTLASGFAQLVRDLLSLDPSDRLLARWRPLDHLLVIELLFDRGPMLRRFGAALARQVDTWMSSVPDHTSLLYEEWIADRGGASRASEVLGSLGVHPAKGAGDEGSWARKEAYLAMLGAVVLYERGRGVPSEDLECRWSLSGLGGVEERWRDERLWLLSGLAEILELRCFYFHLREECGADQGRIKRVKETLLQMRTQVFELLEHLRYCSPLGPLLRGIREGQRAGNGLIVGFGSMRRLEDVGVRSLNDLAPLRVADLVELGIRRDFAEQIRTFVHCRLE